MKKYQQFVAGAFIDSSSGSWFDTENPYTGQAWAKVSKGTDSDMKAAIDAAHEAFTTGSWSKSTPSERGALLREIGDVIAENAEFLADCEVRDNGKLRAEMLAQLRYMPEYYYYYAGLADKVEGSVLPLDKKGFFAYTEYEPLGVIGIITPWNSPLNLTTWKLAPALAAGNTVVIKPSEFTSTSILELMTLLQSVNVPRGVINVVTGFGAEVGAPLVSSEKVAKIAFTGSDDTGKAIYSEAGKTMKHVTLELGGKSPNIVFDDCDLEEAVNGAISGIFAATGQTCIAGSRLLVQDSIHDEFVETLLAKIKTVKMGDPMDDSTQVGPITTKPQFEKVLSYIDVAKNEGAKLVFGGSKGNSKECGSGWFVEPTIFTEVKENMRIAQEEVFGPILSIIRFKDEKDALEKANNSKYGLAAGVWTTDMKKAFRMTSALKAGTVWVNTYRTLSYMAPFGGYKQSGIGRENGSEMIKEYLQQKSVWINIGAKTGNPFVQR